MQNDDDTSVRSSQIICELGHYCVGGVKTKCPPGTYGDTTGLSTIACSGHCDAGKPLSSVEKYGLLSLIVVIPVSVEWCIGKPLSF